MVVEMPRVLAAALAARVKADVERDPPARRGPEDGTWRIARLEVADIPTNSGVFVDALTGELVFPAQTNRER